MKAVKFMILGAAGIAALGVAAPAAAQYPGYGGYPYGYGNSTGNVIGQVLNTILNPYGQFGYNRGVNPQVAVSQCANAVNQRLARYGAGYGGYGGYGGYQPYGYSGYGNAYGGGQVVAITRVDQRSASTLRVRGLATSGMAYGSPYGGGYGGYGAYGAQQPADLTFRCDVDYRGYIRDIDIDRRY